MLEGVKKIELSAIRLDHVERQRQSGRGEDGTLDVESDGLLDSVRAHGVLSPILLDNSNTLIFGERRLTAARLAGLSEIPFIYVSDLSPSQAEAFELIENIRRKSLHWIDEVRAVGRYHTLKKSESSNWLDKDTERELGYDQSRLSVILRVFEDLTDDRVLKCSTVREAYNLLSRRDERARQDLISDITSIGNEIWSELGTDTLERPLVVAPGGEVSATPSSANGPGGHGAIGHASAPLPRGTGAPPLKARPRKSYEIPAQESILNVEFEEWLTTYSGPKFSFVHCDFPYGTNVFGGGGSYQSGRTRWDTKYEDGEDVYWDLITGFCNNLDVFMAQSAHLIFWTKNDIEYQWRTIARFRDLAPSLIFNTTPLVWHKTDNVGIIADPRGEPRNIYETALVATRGERPIIRATSNVYGCPTDKSLHPSTKPESMLRQFFSMFVDSNSRVLDPTCGSGSSLRAAESLGASVLGLEVSPEFHSGALGALQSFRNKRRLELMS